MLIRKIHRFIEDYLKSGTDQILLLEGAGQIGKSYIVRETGKRILPNFVEINFVEDYLILSMAAGPRLQNDKFTSAQSPNVRRNQLPHAAAHPYAEVSVNGILRHSLSFL